MPRFRLYARTADGALLAFRLDTPGALFDTALATLRRGATDAWVRADDEADETRATWELAKAITRLRMAEADRRAA